MTKMKFYKSSQFWERNIEWFLHYKSIILSQIPDARIEHIGASSVRGAISKGDLDIFVGVARDEHLNCIRIIENLGFRIKENTLRTEELCMLENAGDEDVSVQLVVNGSKYEFFISFRDELLKNKNTLNAYNNLKIGCTGKSSKEYRTKKSKFIERILFP